MKHKEKRKIMSLVNLFLDKERELEEPIMDANTLTIKLKPKNGN